MPLSTSHIDDIFTSREEGIKRLLSSILNLNIQHEINEKHIITIINKLLSTAKHRREGLEYLNEIIDNCSSSAIIENAINWTSHCIIKFSEDVLRELKLRILGKIIEVAHNESEFNKKLVSDYMPKVLEHCITVSHVNPYECKTAITTLTILMRYYPSWFGAHRQKIENFLLIFLDSENADLVLSAALAFHYLQQVGSAGVNSGNHKMNFTQNFHKLCRTIHKLYDVFFENEKEIFRNEKSSNDDIFKFQDDPSSNTQVLLHINARRIRNVLLFIETMIKTKFTVAKETKPKELLEVITRGTSIHKCISGDNIESLETYQFSFLLSEIQCSILKLLRLFIIWYQTNCLPFSYSISKILVDSIERSHNCECFKYDSLYQESSYRALSEWLAISKSSLHPQFQSQILVCILKDVTPVKTQITLTISEALSGKKSQKAKRRAMTNRIISSGNQTLSNESSTHYEKNNERNTCKFALTALRHLLELTRLNVKLSLLKDLYKFIFDSLTTIQSSKPLHPYTDSQCQAKLYEVLVAIYQQNTVSSLPPLQTTLDILTRGANDNNRLVAEICQRGLRNLEILCQPICPSLYLRAEEQDGAEEDMLEPRLVREVIETEEIIVEEEEVLDDEEDLSVDYDASTDEFPQNDSVKRDSSNYDFDRSTDDGHRDTDVSNCENKLDDLDVQAADEDNQIEEQMEIYVPSTVTTPNKDDNERLELETLQLEEEEIDRPSCSYASQQEKHADSTKENQQDRDESIEDECEPEITINKEAVELATSKDSKNESSETVSSNTTNKDEEHMSANLDIENNDKQREVSLEKEESEGDADSTGIQMETDDEPAAKKAKITLEDDLDMGDVVNEEVENNEDKEKGVAEDPESSYLEDDSFVDEVKDYY